MRKGNVQDTHKLATALTEYAATLGYDIAMVRTPHYYKAQTTPANTLAFYRFVADRSWSKNSA